MKGDYIYSSEEMTNAALEKIKNAKLGQCVICGLETWQRLGSKGEFVCSNFDAPISLDCKNVWRHRRKYGIEYHDYRSYIGSKEWELKANHAKLLADKACEHCNKSGYQIKQLHAHHNNYDNLYQETKEDIDVLCDSCHRKVHGID